MTKQNLLDILATIFLLNALSMMSSLTQNAKNLHEVKWELDVIQYTDLLVYYVDGATPSCASIT